MGDGQEARDGGVSRDQKKTSEQLEAYLDSGSVEVRANDTGRGPGEGLAKDDIEGRVR